MLLGDADKLINNCGDRFTEVTEYQLLVRCLSEQTIMEDGKRRLRNKEDGGMSSDILQSPADPDATYREKAGKQHRGYVGNIEESVGENGSVVTGYGYETNNTSDSAMLKDHLEKMDKQEQETLVVTDGAYAGEENTKLAAEKNVKLVTTDLPGSDVPARSPADISKPRASVRPPSTGHAVKTVLINTSAGQRSISGLPRSP